MCGIIAAYSLRRPVDRDAIARGLAALHHRGPDYAGSWVSEGGRVALGHTLLAITDAGGGHQPILSPHGRRAITVNGEFYDWLGIRRELEADGYAFRTNSDSEVALHLHHRLGASCLSRLRGEFAFILWDQDQKSLFAARDRYGVCPLLYAEHDGTLYFASEAKALFAMGVPAAWDREAVFLQMHGLLPPGRTLFAGVRSVPPGHHLTVDGGGIRLQRYWDVDLPQATTLRDEPDADGVEALRSKVLEAVRLRVPGEHVRWGVFLSGGLDSSAVSGIVARDIGRSVPAYSVRFDHGPYDESAVARRTAETLGLELVEVHASAQALADAFDEAILHTESLASNSAPSGKLLLSRQARADGLRVVLTGEGADEVFLGYEEMWPGPPAWREDPRLAFGYRMLGDMPLWLGGAALQGYAARDLLSPDFRLPFEAMDPIRSFLEAFDLDGMVRGRDPRHQSLYLWARSVLPNYLLRALGDGCERANSIEARLPLLDHVMVETAIARGSRPEAEPPKQTKRMLRDAMRPYVTDEVYQGPKWPFVAPPAALAPDGPLMTRLGDLLASRALDDLPFADAAAVRARFDALRAGEQGAQGMMAQLAAERSLQRFASACVLQQGFNPS
jgi:asparagine synthase (glutamine-hydrolysing)